MASQQSVTDPVVGRTLEGRYRILGRVARGGMSVVYEAVDERLDRLVAVKIMAAALSADPAFSDRFSREARAAARLSHVNAVAVYDQGRDEATGHVFLVMELVDGRTLRELIRERHGRFTPAEAVSIMEPVLAALAAAHRAGIIHRDVKPENILLSDDGVVKVADFGLARAIESNAESTRTGLMMGTVAYCSPEQITRGQGDARTDVYSAGIVLFELLTGAPPFTGESAMNVAYQHVHSRVPAPSSLNPAVPPALDALVLTVTDSNPAGRPGDAAEFLAGLADVRARLALPVVPLPPRERRTPAVTTAPAAPPLAPPVGVQGVNAPAANAPTVDVRTVDARATTELLGAPPRPATPHPAAPPLVTPPLAASQPTAHTAAVSAPGQLPPRRPGSATPGRRGTQPLPASAAGPASRASNHAAPTVPSPQRPAGAPAAQVRPARAEQHPGNRKRRARRLSLIVLALVVLLGVAAGLSGWWLSSGRYSRVPDVSRYSQADAVHAITEAGYKVGTVGRAYSHTERSGTVISTDPAIGARLVRGQRINLVISSGKEMVSVPDIAKGTDKNEVLNDLTSRGLKVKWADAAFNDSVPVDGLLKMKPAAGASLERGYGTVTVTVSKGPDFVTVPAVPAGATWKSAATALKDAELVPVRADVFDDTVPAGQVISLSPSDKQIRGQKVTVTVSKGPEYVTIPSFTPYITDAADAEQQLRDLNLNVQIQKVAGGHFGKVFSVSPDSGTQAHVGDTVTLKVI